MTCSVPVARWDSTSPIAQICGPSHGSHRYDCPMKRIIVLVALAAIAAIVYKVLSAEIPIDES